MAARGHRVGAAGSRNLAAASGCRASLVLGFALLFTGPPAGAAEWTVEPFVRVSETWTDNFNLSADDPDEEWITEVAPTVRLRGEGRRAQFDLAYRLQHLLHANESERDDTNHQLSAAGDVELVRERLFFDADATRSLSTTGTAFTTPTSDVVASDQRQTITTWSGGPRLQYPLGRFADLTAEVRRDHVDFDTAADGESDSDSAAIGLSSGALFTRLGWALDYQQREESREETNQPVEDTRFQQIRGELNLRAGSRTQLFVAGGKEDNDFETAEAGDATDGDFWEIGFRWNPRRTVSLEVAGGERFFGDTARVNLGLRGSALSLQLNVSEDLVTTPELQFERQTLLLLDDQGNPVVGPGGQPATVVVDVPTVRDDVIVQQRASLRIGWSRSHTSIALTLLGTDRDFQREDTSEDTRQIDLDVTWTRLDRTILNAGIGLREREERETATEDEFASLRLGATRQMRGNTELQLEYERAEQDSTNPGRNYESDRVTLALQVGF